MNTLIAIPTYNEEKNIQNLIFKIKEILNGHDYSILVIDDNSADNTSKIVKNIQESESNVFLLNRPGKLGLASAYIDAFNFGISKNFDSIIQMDADFSHNPIYLPEMIKNLSEYDVSIGSRNIKGGKTPDWGILRNIISKGGSLYSKLILGCPINDLTSGFNGWRTDILKKINLNTIISNGYSFQIEMKYKAYKNNAKIKEFPIIFEDRKFGKSKMSKEIFFEALLNVIKIKLSD